MAATKILIADDHPLFRDALRHVCERVTQSPHVIEVAGYGELLGETREDERFDLVVVDLSMPGGNEFDELRSLRGRIPTTPTIVVSSHDDAPTIRRAMASGIAGYVPKSLDVAAMQEAIRIVLAGGTFEPATAAGAEGADEPDESERLTPRQVAVLENLARGRSNREIASDLGIEEITVKVHISAILRKLHVKSRLEAVLAFQRNGASTTPRQTRASV